MLSWLGVGGGTMVATRPASTSSHLVSSGSISAGDSTTIVLLRSQDEDDTSALGLMHPPDHSINKLNKLERQDEEESIQLRILYPPRNRQGEIVRESSDLFEEKPQVEDSDNKRAERSGSRKSFSSLERLPVAQVTTAAAATRTTTTKQEPLPAVPDLRPRQQKQQRSRRPPSPHKNSKNRDSSFDKRKPTAVVLNPVSLRQQQQRQHQQQHSSIKNKDGINAELVATPSKNQKDRMLRGLFRRAKGGKHPGTVESPNLEDGGPKRTKSTEKKSSSEFSSEAIPAPHHGEIDIEGDETIITAATKSSHESPRGQGGSSASTAVSSSVATNRANKSRSAGSSASRAGRNKSATHTPPMSLIRVANKQQTKTRMVPTPPSMEELRHEAKEAAGADPSPTDADDPTRYEIFVEPQEEEMTRSQQQDLCSVGSSSALSSSQQQKRKKKRWISSLQNKKQPLQVCIISEVPYARKSNQKGPAFKSKNTKKSKQHGENTTAPMMMHATSPPTGPQASLSPSIGPIAVPAAAESEPQHERKLVAEEEVENESKAKSSSLSVKASKDATAMVLQGSERNTTCKNCNNASPSLQVPSNPDSATTANESAARSTLAEKGHGDDHDKIDGDDVQSSASPTPTTRTHNHDGNDCGTLETAVEPVSQDSDGESNEVEVLYDEESKAAAALEAASEQDDDADDDSSKHNEVEMIYDDESAPKKKPASYKTKIVGDNHNNNNNNNNHHHHDALEDKSVRQAAPRSFYEKIGITKPKKEAKRLVAIDPHDDGWLEAIGDIRKRRQQQQHQQLQQNTKDVKKAAASQEGKGRSTFDEYEETMAKTLSRIFGDMDGTVVGDDGLSRDSSWCEDGASSIGDTTRQTTTVHSMRSFSFSHASVDGESTVVDHVDLFFPVCGSSSGGHKQRRCYQDAASLGSGTYGGIVTLGDDDDTDDKSEVSSPVDPTNLFLRTFNCDF